MKYLARLDESNVVHEVVVISDEDALKPIESLLAELALVGRWVHSDANNYAGVGFTFDETLGTFVAPYSPTHDFPA